MVKVAQWIQHFRYRREDLSWGPQHPCQTLGMAYVHLANPALGLEWVETGGCWEWAGWPARKNNQQKTLCPGSDKEINRGSHLASCSGLHICMHGYMHVNMHTVCIYMMHTYT